MAAGGLDFLTREAIARSYRAGLSAACPARVPAAAGS
jgi:hypothetical protein